MSNFECFVIGLLIYIWATMIRFDNRTMAIILYVLGTMWIIKGV